MSDKQTIEQLQRTAHFAAWRAGQIVRERYQNPGEIRHKGPRDLVTEVDGLAQDAALATIKSYHPDHHILAEEDSSNHRRKDGNWVIPDGVVWLVDPIDGTTNFTTNLPMFCVSVGVAIDGEPVAGAIYDPIRQDFFLAGKGLGATLNGTPLPALAPKTVSDAVISLDWAHDPVRRDRALRTVGALAGNCRTIRALGSAALAMAYVACGRLDMYMNFGLQPWDLAAGAVIIREAGGTLRSPDDELWTLGKAAVFAGHADLLNEAYVLVGE